MDLTLSEDPLDFEGRSLKKKEFCEGILQYKPSYPVKQTKEAKK